MQTFAPDNVMLSMKSPTLMNITDFPKTTATALNVANMNQYRRFTFTLVRPAL